MQRKRNYGRLRDSLNHHVFALSDVFHEFLRHFMYHNQHKSGKWRGILTPNSTAKTYNYAGASVQNRLEAYHASSPVALN
jgi:hypothetical protein